MFPCKGPQLPLLLILLLTKNCSDVFYPPVCLIPNRGIRLQPIIRLSCVLDLSGIIKMVSAIGGDFLTLLMKNVFPNLELVYFCLYVGLYMTAMYMLYY